MHKPVDNSGLFVKFLTWKEHNEGCAAATVNKYLLFLERLRRFLDEEQTPVLEATPEQLQHFTGLHAHAQGISPRSRRPLISAVRGFYAWACRERLIRTDPASQIDYPRIGRKVPRGIQREHVEKILMAPDLNTFLGVRDLAIMMMLAGTGIRVSGLCAMNESSLQFLEEDGQARLVVRVKEKGGHERLIPAPAETLWMMHAYLGHEELQTIDRTLPDGDSVLFVSINRRNISPADYFGEARRLTDRSICTLIEKYGKKMKLPREMCHPHAFRHLYGTELAESDVDVIKIQALMGHADPKTSEIYIHTAMRKLSKVVDQANPLSKIRTPLSDLSKRLRNGR